MIDDRKYSKRLPCQGFVVCAGVRMFEVLTYNYFGYK